MAAFKKLFLLFLLCIAFLPVVAQVPQWALSIGSAANDDGRSCVVAPNGNVYLAGLFSGTVDLDPSAATYNVTSNGLTDIFLACYTSSGSFLWGLSVGGTSYDGALSVAVDKDNNALIAGFFSGQNVNFDPLSAGKFLSDAGIAGPVIEQGGDGFVAKYGPTGVCAWAIDLGDSSVYDLAESVGTDEKGNVYVGGDFHFTMDIDPSAGSNILNALTGTAYLVKYSPAGQLLWGFNFGGGGNDGVDNSVWDIKSDNAGNIYLAGCFQATSNFSSIPVAGSTLTCAGVYDGYLAKYDTAGNYKFVTSMSGPNNDQAQGIAFDSVGNVYVTGYTSSDTLTFNPSLNTFPAPGHGGNQDMFLASYTNQGIYKWAHVMGSRQDETGASVAIIHSQLYCTGYFQDTVDFDPSPATAYLISNGKSDVYICKYDLDGNYICGFNTGSSDNDEGRHLAADAQGYLYSCGQFTGINTNFSPAPVPAYLTTQGAGDIYLVKYDWQGLPVAPGGYLVADTICKGSPAYLTFIATIGTGPYTIIYTTGQDVDTTYNIYSNQQIYLNHQPAVTTTYKLVLILSSGNCEPPGYVDTTATIIVNPLPVITVSNDTSVCPGTRLRLWSSGGYTCYWYGAGIDSPTVTDPSVLATVTTDYRLVATDSIGCEDTASVNVTIYPALFAVDAAQKKLCSGDTVQLSATGADTYIWYPDTALSAGNMADPRAWPLQNITYTVAMTEKTCGRKDTLSVQVIVNSLPNVQIVEAHDIDCGNKAGLIVATGAQNYQWYPDTDINNPTSATPTVYPTASMIYYVKGTDENSCSSTDSVNIQAFYNGTGRLFAPTAFTPNGDGKNDCFSIHVPGEVSDYELKIFNRWGQNVFVSYTYGQCWNGTFIGTPQDMGTYFYYYKCMSTSCGALEGQGDVQLIR